MMMGQQQWPRGPLNELHEAAYDGSARRTTDLLSRGTINIDQGNPSGWTPLMYAVQDGHSRVAKILLNRGANVSIAADCGTTALHLSAQNGHLSMTVDLVEAGADVDARGPEGATPLHLAVQNGHSEVMATLIDAGADADRRAGVGRTPLYMAALEGHLDAAKELLRAKANPLLTAMTRGGFVLVPLDVAAHNGHSEVVRGLVRQVGIAGCGGDSGGVDALRLAGQNQHLDIMAMLTDAGVVDTGDALLTAAGCGQAAPVNSLLQQRQLQGSPTGLVGYVNFCDYLGCTPLFRGIDGFASHDGEPLPISPKVVRLLIDAGADTSSAVRVKNTRGAVIFHGTPLDFTNECLQKKQVARGKGATEEQLHMLEAVRRLLLRVEAAHAASWLWPREPLLVSRTSVSKKSKWRGEKARQRSSCTCWRLSAACCFGWKQRMPPRGCGPGSPSWSAVLQRFQAGPPGRLQRVARS